MNECFHMVCHVCGQKIDGGKIQRFRIQELRGHLFVAHQDCYKHLTGKCVSDLPDCVLKQVYEDTYGIFEEGE